MLKANLRTSRRRGSGGGPEADDGLFCWRSGSVTSSTSYGILCDMLCISIETLDKGRCDVEAFERKHVSSGSASTTSGLIIAV